jgi:hypothetical protein
VWHLKLTALQQIFIENVLVQHGFEMNQSHYILVLHNMQRCVRKNKYYEESTGIVVFNDHRHICKLQKEFELQGRAALQSLMSCRNKPLGRR